MKTALTGLTTYIVKRCIGPFRYRRLWLKKTQRYSSGQLEAIQLKLLQELIKYAYKNVPYYRQLMGDRAIEPADIQAIEDIQKFPILTKKDLLKAGCSIVSKRVPKIFLRKAYTGGTTGTPVILHRNLFSIGNEHAFVRRQFEWADIKTHDRVAYLTGRVIIPPDQTEGNLYVYDPIMKELILSTYHLSEKSAKQYINTMKRYNVEAITGYPSAVSFLARICLDSEETFSLKAALTTSETLTNSMRDLISRAFSCPVYDYYGSAERVCYIFTCEKGGYHIQPEYGYTELIPVDNTGLCKVVSTGFWNKSMPFIRYDTGDTVVKSNNKCSCGRNFPMIEEIKGRVADTIKTPSGREFGAAILTHLLYGTDHIFESQILQDRIDHVFIDYVPSELFNQRDYDAFVDLIKHHLPSELKVDFRRTESIPRTSSGKVRPVVSMIQ